MASLDGGIILLREKVEYTQVHWSVNKNSKEGNVHWLKVMELVIVNFDLLLVLILAKAKKQSQYKRRYIFFWVLSLTTAM